MATQATSLAQFKSIDSTVVDDLIGSNAADLLAKKFTLLSGQGVVKRGTVLGAITTVITAPTSAAVGGNTGNGTMGAVTASAGVLPGVYTLEIVTAAANAGFFEVRDPQGDVMGTGNVAAAFSAGGLAFTLADGATDFVSGDSFTITVAAGSGKVKTSLAAGTDGSQTADSIAAEDADATSADAQINAFVRGSFNEHALILGAGQTLASIREGLRVKGIFLETPVKRFP